MMPVGNQQYNQNNNRNQQTPFYNTNNYQNNMYQNNNYQNNSNNYQNQGDINPDSLVIVPANSGVYYVADPDVFPMEMIQHDTQGNNNSNEKGFWIYLSRIKDLDNETMARIQNEQIQSNNQYTGQQNYNNGYNQDNIYFNSYNNLQQLPLTNSTQRFPQQLPINDNIQQLPLNNYTRQLQLSSNNQQLSLPVNPRNLTLLDSNSSNTAVINENTPLLITPVEVNGTTVCAIKPAQSENRNTDNNGSNRFKVRDNLPTLNNLTRTQILN